MSVVRGLECTEKGGKFEFSAQAQDMAPFDANVTKVKIPFEIKPPLVRGHSTTTWTEFCHFFIPLAWTKTDIF